MTIEHIQAINQIALCLGYTCGTLFFLFVVWVIFGK